MQLVTLQNKETNETYQELMPSDVQLTTSGAWEIVGQVEVKDIVDPYERLYWKMEGLELAVSSVRDAVEKLKKTL